MQGNLYRIFSKCPPNTTKKSCQQKGRWTYLYRGSRESLMSLYLSYTGSRWSRKSLESLRSRKSRKSLRSLASRILLLSLWSRMSRLSLWSRKSLGSRMSLLSRASRPFLPSLGSLLGLPRIGERSRLVSRLSPKPYGSLWELTKHAKTKKLWVANPSVLYRRTPPPSKYFSLKYSTQWEHNWKC